MLTVTPPPLEQVRPGLPPVLYATIARCLEKERERRWSSVADLVTALAPIAPPRAQPLIERIAGASLGRTALDVSGAGRVPAAGNVASARTGPPSKTAPGWAETGGGGKAKSGNKGLIAAAVSAIVLVAITAVAVPMVRRGAHGPDGGSAATTAAAGSANESISALPAVQPPARTDAHRGCRAASPAGHGARAERERERAAGAGEGSPGGQRARRAQERSDRDAGRNHAPDDREACEAGGRSPRYEQLSRVDPDLDPDLPAYSPIASAAAFIASSAPRGSRRATLYVAFGASIASQIGGRFPRASK